MQGAGARQAGDGRHAATTAAWHRSAPLLVLAGLLIAGILAACVVLILTLRTDGIEDRRRELDNLAFALAEQTARDFLSLDIIQNDIEDQLAQRGISDPSSFAAGIGTQSFHRQLAEKVSGLPHLGALTLLDEGGSLVNYSRYWPVPGVSLAEDAYFRALNQAGRPPVFVGGPMVNPASDSVTLFFARPLLTRQGRFLGALVATVEQDYFEQIFGALRLGKDGLIALVRTDGTLLARFPLSAGHGPADAAAPARRLFFSPGFTGTVAAGVLDAHARIATVHRVGNLPLAVVVSDSTAAIEAELLRRLTPIAVAAGFMCLTIGLASYVVMRDVKGTKAFADAQHAAARSDPLTGLANRLAFTEQLEALARAPGAPRPVALLFLDLDYFKVVNDTLGHHVGDAMLVQLAIRLQAALPGYDTIARLGGDEFAILHPGARTDEEAQAFAGQVIELFREPFIVDGHRLLPGCSIGVALYPRDGTDVTTLMKNADLALYRAKADGRGVARVFHEAMERTARERRGLELDLRAAWRDRQFHLVYQPIFEAGSGALAGFEALARWQHPERGAVPPDVFIPLAEENGLILPLGAWVLSQACRAAAEWPAPLFVAVNLSPVQFRGAQAFHQVRAALDSSGLAPERLEIEITESTLLLEGPVVRATLEQFHEEGIVIALDDFGTGYSSLRYLRTLRIGRIKVDRSFVEEVERSADSRAILEAVTTLATALRLRCTAEGIENEAQRAYMAALGCSHLQGYLLGRPLAPDDALRLARGARA